VHCFKVKMCSYKNVFLLKLNVYKIVMMVITPIHRVPRLRIGERPLDIEIS